MFRGTVIDGKISFSPRVASAFQQWKADHEGAHVLITHEKPVRSPSQNRYYWLYLAVISRETGENEDDLHEYFKRKFLPPVFKVIQGEDVQMPGSTQTLSKGDFTEYLDKIAAHTEIPLPDIEAAGYITNYEPRKSIA